MGLFSKIKKGLKKVFNKVKKVVKKVVKKIGSSKILKALAIAAAVVVTGGAALGAMGATAASGGFTGWMVGASQAVTSGTLFGTSTALARGAGTAAKLAASPFKALGTGIGTVGAKLGVNLATPTASIPGTIPSAAGTGATGTAATGASTLTAPAAITTNPAAAAQASTAASRGALNVTASGLPGAASVSSTGIPTVGAAGSGTLASNVTAGMSAAQASTVAGLQSGAITTSQIAANAAPQASWFARHPKLTEAGVFVGKQVAGAAIAGTVGQYIAGDPEQQGSMARAAYEGGEYLDPLKVYAAQQGINTDSIYQHMMYGNQDPSTQYGSELFRQQTFGVA